MRRKIEKKIQELIFHTIHEEEKLVVDRNESLIALGYDSISMIHLQVEIEDEFRFMFDPIEDDFEQIFSSVANLYDYVVHRVMEQKCWPGMR